MNLSQLVRLACSQRDENEMGADPEVYIMDEDGVMWDLDVGYVPEQFDGFETAYPACIKLTKKDVQ